MKKPELLAPAGNLVKLKTAVQYGADAVYIGGEDYSLRTAADNFSFDEMARGAEYAHNRHARVYLACNAVPHNSEVEAFADFIMSAAKTGVDAYIVTDLGLFAIIRRCLPDAEIHVSTQANTLNYEACNMWDKLGAKRIVLARELTLEEITEIRRNIPYDLELEAFVHGAMCMSHSGRCLLSSFMTGREANHGDCAHPCRWNYSLMEEKRQGEYFPIYETDSGTFILNSKDLCMIEYIPDLINAGIDSLKLEGRVKSEYYVASIVSAYRRAIDDCFENLEKYEENKEKYLKEVCKVSHRDYYTGFYFGNEGKEGQIYKTSSYIRDYDLVAVVESYDSRTGLATLRQRNKFLAGETLEVLTPFKEPFEFKVGTIYNEEGGEIYSAPHADMRIRVPIPKEVCENTFLRREKY